MTHRQADGIELEKSEKITTVQDLVAIVMGSNRLPRQRFISFAGGITQAVFSDMRTLVVGFMDENTFKRRGFDKVGELIHKLFRARLETSNQVVGRNSANSVTK